MTPALRSLRSRLAAHVMHSQYDARETTAKARGSFRQSFYDRTDPNLSHEERLRRADHLYRAHMARLSLLAAQARRAKKAS